MSMIHLISMKSLIIKIFRKVNYATSLMLISFLLFCNVIFSKDTKEIISKTHSKPR